MHNIPLITLLQLSRSAQKSKFHNRNTSTTLQHMTLRAGFWFLTSQST